MTIVYGLALLFILGVMSSLLDEGEEGGAAVWPIWMWAVLLPASAGALFWFRKMLGRNVTSAATAEEAHGPYRTRLFLQIAYAQSPALVAFVVFFVSYTLVPYLVSLPIALGLIAYGSPRAGDVRRLQERIDEAGGRIDLAAVLMGVGDA